MLNGKQLAARASMMMPEEPDRRITYVLLNNTSRNSVLCSAKVQLL
jgi:hypothetical protein